MFAVVSGLEGLTLAKLSEEELVRAVLAGDKAAYGTLYDRFAPLVRAICHDSTGNLADAQDLAQDVFLRAYQRLGDLQKPESFAPWIIGVAKRRCLEWRRQIVRDQRRRQRVQEMKQAGADPADDGELAGLGRLITALPETERLALHAFYLRGKSVEDARQVVGLSRSGFYKVLKQALVRLKRSVVQESEGAG
jgi:RNA polymerase sigma-70 factor (ECF subfamily)